MTRSYGAAVRASSATSTGRGGGELPMCGHYGGRTVPGRVTVYDELNHRLEDAASHATLDVPVARRLQTAGEVRDALVGESYGYVDDIAVLDGPALVGIVPIERLLAAAADARIEDVMEEDPPVVAPGADQEHVLGG